ncbi:hypothetical protein SO802_001142 [Lithocarpus litseifolius]|uniref:HAT C-terminal dimerisation domain-containing protein n=1 Tax=Lithocarpus litseifolius TaxID=425828 RepID=A0AAW2DTV9_9ROSI
MDEIFVVSGRLQRNIQQNTNLHHYRAELFYTVIDMQLQELNNCFSEANTDLLFCMACLSPSNSFVAFDKEKLIRLAKFYPSDFLGIDILAFDSQLQNYIFDMRSNDFFLSLQGVSELAKKLVSTRKHETYPLVYLLVKLALTLPVAVATVERSFLAMRYVKNELCNRMGDQWMNDCLVVMLALTLIFLLQQLDSLSHCPCILLHRNGLDSSLPTGGVVKRRSELLSFGLVLLLATLFFLKMVCLEKHMTEQGMAACIPPLGRTRSSRTSKTLLFLPTLYL